MHVGPTMQIPARAAYCFPKHSAARYREKLSHFLRLSTEQSADYSVGTKLRMGSRDGRVDGDDVFDTAATPGNIVTTVTIDTLRVE